MIAFHFSTQIELMIDMRLGCWGCLGYKNLYLSFVCWMIFGLMTVRLIFEGLTMSGFAKCLIFLINLTIFFVKASSFAQQNENV